VRTGCRYRPGDLKPYWLGVALATLGDSYGVLKGLSAGEAVVTERRFFLGAESLRNGPPG
jgi:hypothetical protein